MRLRASEPSSDVAMKRARFRGIDPTGQTKLSTVLV
jgi:hypothetical protein